MTLLGILVFSAACAVIGGMHWYVWRRSVRASTLPRGWRIAIAAVFVTGMLMLPLTVLMVRVLSREALGLWFCVLLFWMVPFSYFLLLTAVADVVRLGARFRGRRATVEGAAGDGGEPVDPGRRVFLARSISGVSLASTGFITAQSVREAHGAFRTPEVPVKLDRLPRALDGLKIAVISDLHVGPLLGRDYVEAAVARTNELKPDLVAITGDLVDAGIAEAGNAVAALAGLRSRFGSYFITGNHEYYTGEPERWLEFLRGLGIRVLDNERVAIGDAGASFDIAGVPDWSRRNDPDRPDLARALAGRDPSRELVLLAHQPKHIHEAARHGVGLQISGHTHGGQVWPFGALLAALGNPYVRGLHRHEGRTWIYVTCGTGFWGAPMRMFVPPEISQIILTA